ncbi:MAG: hypothetical protein KGJ06_08475 [Pseudomonadota bacterium]|nr:hypothetical protein [Pseudomonadota bacterium]
MERKYSFLTLLITSAELTVVIGSRIAESKNIFYSWLVYGSPLYLLMNLLSASAEYWKSNPILIALGVFHIFKYLLFFKARTSDVPNFLLPLSIVFEATYLILSGYSLN